MRPCRSPIYAHAGGRIVIATALRSKVVLSFFEALPGLSLAHPARCVHSSSGSETSAANMSLLWRPRASSRSSSGIC